MDELSKEYVISFFNRTLQTHGDRPESLRWSAGGQRLHYECLLDIGNISGKKILDYGCGKGDLYQYLRDRDIPVDYTGFDINEQLISLARKKFPECRFRVFDIEREKLNEEFDYIFLCGVFNLKVSGLESSIKNTLTELFKKCRRALAFNALSSHDPERDFELHYIDPDDLYNFAVSNLSPGVSFARERIPYDFTMFICRQEDEAG